jgi:hypothetical protein
MGDRAMINPVAEVAKIQTSNHATSSSSKGTNMRRHRSNSAICVLLLALWSHYALEYASLAAEPQSPSSAGSGASSDKDTTAARSEASQPQNVQKRELPRSLLSLFQPLDKLGRDDLKDAKFVKLEFADADDSRGEQSENAWLLARDEGSIKVLKDDLIPWVYNTKSGTIVPASWHPRTVGFKSISETDFEKFCRDLAKPNSQTNADPIVVSLFPPGPSQRVLIAHAAWKKGLLKYCEPIVSANPNYKSDFEAFQSAVYEDLAWLHFLRGVNLLMFADRQEVLPHLRLILELSPKGEFAVQSKDLLDHLEKLIADEKKPKQPLDESKLKDSELADLYVSRLKDVHCPQMMQPGFIMPYMGTVVGKPGDALPTVKLKDMGMAAVPALIKALDDEAPTRTVYHWRDFHHSRLVWRVSDFAWNILRDITHKDFGNRNSVGFTLWLGAGRRETPAHRVDQTLVRHQQRALGR